MQVVIELQSPGMYSMNGSAILEHRNGVVTTVHIPLGDQIEDLLRQGYAITSVTLRDDISNMIQR